MGGVRIVGIGRKWGATEQRRFLAALAVSILVGMSFVGGVLAYGTQNHTSNGVTHGCPFDPGCATSPGDYNRHGYDLNTVAAVDYMYVSIWNAETNTFKISKDCSNCFRVDVQWDTNPKLECDFKTFHDTVDPVYNLNGHWHWTASATGPNGC